MIVPHLVSGSWLDWPWFTGVIRPQTATPRQLTTQYRQRRWRSLEHLDFSMFNARLQSSFVGGPHLKDGALTANGAP